MGVLGGGLTPKPSITDNIFFQNGISVWHLLYTVKHNHLKFITFSEHTQTTHNRHVSNDNWHTAGQILYDIFVFHHSGTHTQVSVFKLFIFTVVKHLALNKRTRGIDFP